MLASYRTYKKENSRSILLICSNNQFNSIQFQHLLFLLGAFFSIDQTFFETNENFLNPTSLSGDKAETATTRIYPSLVIDRSRSYQVSSTFDLFIQWRVLLFSYCLVLLL